MELLNNIWTTPVVPWNSVELKQQNLKFHGIPWNFVQIHSSMEFHGTFSILPSSMEFHGIPWNLVNLIFKKIMFLNIVVGIWLMIRCYLAKFSQKRYILHWFQYRNSYFEHPSVSENGARSAKMACCYKHIFEANKIIFGSVYTYNYDVDNCFFGYYRWHVMYKTKESVLDRYVTIHVVWIRVWCVLNNHAV